MRILSLSSTLIIAAILVATACRSESGATEPAPAPAEAAAADKDDKKPYEIKVTLVKTKTGEVTDAIVEFVPATGFKFNKEFPGALKAKPGSERLELKKNEFKQLKGDFVLGDKGAKVKIPFQAKTAGKDKISCEGRVSFCNERTCLVEKYSTEIDVEVASK